MPATKEETAVAAWRSPEAARLGPAWPSPAGDFQLFQPLELASTPTAARPRPLAPGRMLAAALRAAQEEIASALARGSAHVGALESAIFRRLRNRKSSKINKLGGKLRRG